MDNLEHDPIDINVNWICISCKEVYTQMQFCSSLLNILIQKLRLKDLYIQWIIIMRYYIF